MNRVWCIRHRKYFAPFLPFLHHLLRLLHRPQFRQRAYDRSVAGARIVTAIYTNSLATVNTNSFPSMQRCNPSFTCCNLYLNMVLNATYYFPMMYGYPVMLSRSVLSYGLFDDQDWFELHVLLLVLSYGAPRVAQAWEIPAIGFGICSWFAYGGWHEWQKHIPE